MKASWSLNNQDVLDSCKILKWYHQFQCIADQNLKKTKQNTTKNTKKPQQNHATKNYYNIDKGIYINVSLGVSQLPIVSWEARIHEIKLFDQQHTVN